MEKSFYDTAMSLQGIDPNQVHPFRSLCFLNSVSDSTYLKIEYKDEHILINLVNAFTGETRPRTGRVSKWRCCWLAVAVSCSGKEVILRRT